jgi:hypothetical protein
MIKSPAQYRAGNWPEATAHGAWWPATRGRRRGHHAQTARGTAWWRAHRRLIGGSTAAMCCRRSRGGHREGAGQGGERRGAPEQRVDDEAAQTVSGGGVQRWRGCSGGRRRARRGPAALVREGEAGVSSNLGVAKLGGHSPEREKQRWHSDRVRRGGGLRWQKTGEVDAWAIRMKARHSGVDGRDKWRTG